MKKDEREAARTLRRKGYSMNQIVKELNVAKSSVSLWVRDIELTKEQKRLLSERGKTLESIEARRKARLSNARSERDVTFTAAREAIVSLTKNDLLFIGLGLYWGEGSKTTRGTVAFYNSDPRAIQVMMRFYQEACAVDLKKIKGRVLIHPHLNAVQAEKYWSVVSGIPLKQFNKTALQLSKSSKGKKDTLPFGTFSITVYDTKLFLKVMGLMEGAYLNITPSKKQVPWKYHQYL